MSVGCGPRLPYLDFEGEDEEGSVARLVEAGKDASGIAKSQVRVDEV